MIDRVRVRLQRPLANARAGNDPRARLDPAPAGSHRSTRDRSLTSASRQEFTRMIRLMILDANTIYAAGLCSLLDRQADLRVIAVAVPDDEAPARAAGTAPDLILLGYAASGQETARACRRLLDASPHSKVLVLLPDALADEAGTLLRAGAAGLCLKTRSVSEIANLLRVVQAGDMALPAPIGAHVVDSLPVQDDQAPSAEAVLSALTRRETDVFQLASRGLKNREIAVELGLSPKTIKTHLRNIYHKLGLSGKSELRLLAYQTGLTDLSTWNPQVPPRSPPSMP
ncbi:MAG: response regulator transcription factor [Anaerolineae bacterium]